MEASYLTVDSSESFPKKWRREEIQVLPQWTVTLMVICGELVNLILSHFMKSQRFVSCSNSKVRSFIVLKW
jgi:hypothetical protein